jgi:Leucine-rich repeat (LRR) protein
LSIYKFQQAFYFKSNQIRPANKDELVKLLEIGIPAQQLVDFLYPQDTVCLFNDYCNNKGKSRSQIIKLDLNSLNLICSLDLADFPNLGSLNCHSNQLTSLEINHCLKLKTLNTSFNQLTEIILSANNQLERIDFRDNLLIAFNYQSLNPKTLIHLNLANNNLEATDLMVFSHLINLN